MLALLTWLVILLCAAACGAAPATTSTATQLAADQPTFVYVYTTW